MSLHTAVEPALCPNTALAKMIAKPKPSANPAIRAKERDEYDNYIKAVNWLAANPSLRGLAVTSMRELSVGQNKAVKGDDGVCEVGTLGKFDLEWVINHNNAEGYGTMSKWATAKQFDSKSPYHFFAFQMNASLSMRIPEACEDPAVMEKACELRIEEAGNRKALLCPAQAFFLGNGSLDWTLGVYEPLWNTADTLVVGAVHRPSGTQCVISEELNIDQDYELSNNWSDDKCEFYKSKHQRFLLKSFFTDKKKAPHKPSSMIGSSKLFQAHVDAAIKALEDGQEQGPSTPEPSLKKKFAEACKQTPGTATAHEKAKEALALRKENAAKKRRISLKKGA